MVISAELCARRFGIARRLRILLERSIGLRLGNALSVLARLFFRDSACFAGLLDCVLCGSLFGVYPLRVFAFGRAVLARLCRFHLCTLSVRGLCGVSQRRRANLLRLGLLRFGGRLQAFRETGFFTRHISNHSFQSNRVSGRSCPVSVLAVTEWTALLLIIS